MSLENDFFQEQIRRNTPEKDDQSHEPAQT